MFKFFLSRYKSLLKEKKIVFPTENAAELVPAYSSYLTNCCPVLGKIITNGMVKLFYGNRLFLNWSYRQQKKVVRSQKEKGNLLVVGDLNIGDAINLQVACTTLKQLFPDKVIHYAINHKAYPLLNNHPDIYEVLPVFSGAPVPTHEDVVRLKKEVEATDYEMVFNYCPFFTDHTFSHSNAKVLNHFPLTMEIAYNELRNRKVNHLRLKIFESLTYVFADLSARHQPVLKDAEVYLHDVALEEAERFLKAHNLWEKQHLVMFNPDATSQFTRFPEAEQVQLLKQLLDHEAVTHLLMGSGFIFRDAEKALLDKLGAKRRQKITIVPKKFALSTYAALLDHCDLYITNDTGPLHLAATRKKTQHGKVLRNQTAIYAVFGATPARIYAYDSDRKAYLPAPQDAPSRVFVSESPCRNITCINKLSKRCHTVRCFEGLDTKQMADEMIEFLKS